MEEEKKEGEEEEKQEEYLFYIRRTNKQIHISLPNSIKQL